ncbi:MAG: Hyaluronan synthase, partial [Firmicutes bacterium]|nr:Hyaluronan synthase [Bacillota bacterium]
MDQFFQPVHKDISEVLPVGKPDRRLLSKVPDKENVRSNTDRRQAISNEQSSDLAALIENEKGGRRYLVNYDVSVQYSSAYRNSSCSGKSIDISTTGMLLEISQEDAKDMQPGEQVRLKFTIVPGTMPEGYEMNVNIAAKIMRLGNANNGKVQCAVQFSETIAQYASKKKNWYMISAASFFLFVTVACVMLMRVESILYFKFNKVLYLYSIIAATFLLSRYFVAMFYRPVPIDPDFTPGVSIVIPCFDEEQMIQRTILGCINQDYPLDKLEVIIVDDCSNDNSFEKIKEIVDELKIKESRYDTQNRIRYIRQAKNAGKREAMAVGSLMAKHE